MMLWTETSRIYVKQNQPDLEAETSKTKRTQQRYKLNKQRHMHQRSKCMSAGEVVFVQQLTEGVQNKYQQQSIHSRSKYTCNSSCSIRRHIECRIIFYTLLILHQMVCYFKKKKISVYRIDDIQ